MPSPMKTKDYAMWRGDEFLAVGSARELADYLGTGINNIYCIVNRCKLRKTDHALYIIEVPDDEEDEA